MNGTDSAAPLATFATTGDSPAARSFGAITACTPTASATRRHAPRLCGIGHPVEHQQQRRVPRRSRRILVEVGVSSRGRTRATTPWWRPPPVQALEPARPRASPARRAPRAAASSIARSRDRAGSRRRGSRAPSRDRRAGAPAPRGNRSGPARLAHASTKSMRACSRSTRTTRTRTRSPSRKRGGCAPRAAGGPPGRTGVVVPQLRDVHQPLDVHLVERDEDAEAVTALMRAVERLADPGRACSSTSASSHVARRLVGAALGHRAVRAERVPVARRVALARAPP